MIENLDDMSGKELTEAAIKYVFEDLPPFTDFAPHTNYRDLRIVFARIGVTHTWTFKKGIELEITSHGITSKGQDTEWEFGYGEGNELGLHLALYHWTQTRALDGSRSSGAEV